MSYLLANMEAARILGEEMKASAARCGLGDREPVGNLLQRLGESFCNAADRMQDQMRHNPATGDRTDG